MEYAFETKLEFRPEAAGFLESADASTRIGGVALLKAGSAGLPDDLAGRVGIVLALDGKEVVSRNEVNEWKTACSYDTSSLSPIEAYAHSVHFPLFAGADRFDVSNRVRCRSDEVDRICWSVRHEAAAVAWEDARCRADTESDLEALFGGGERRPLVYRGDLERWYLEHGTLARDFSEMLSPPVLMGGDRLRVLYDRKALVGRLATSFEEREFVRLRVMAGEWSEIAGMDGGSIVRDCAANVAILSALAEAGAKTVKAVFLEGGQAVEHALPASYLEDEVCSGEGYSLSGCWFTPQLRQNPDMSAFLGIKFRGKWIYRVS